jgi:hypothetical protein
MKWYEGGVGSPLLMWKLCATPWNCPNALERLIEGTPNGAVTTSAFHWTEALNGREWATVVWATIALAWVLSRGDTRGYIVTIVRVPFSKVVFPRAALMLAYIGSVIFAASRIGLWEVRLTGVTLAWIAASAAAGFFKVLEIPNSQRYFHTAFARAVAITILIDAYVNVFVFPFWIEVWLLPAIALVYMLKAVGEAKDEFESTRGCFNAIAGFIGIGLLTFATIHLIGELSIPNLPRLGKSLILPMWLNVALIPFSYLVALQLVYQGVFVDVRSASNASRTSIRRAKLAVLIGVGPRAYLLGNFGPPWPERLNSARTLDDARHVVGRLCRQRAAEATAIASNGPDA